MNNLQLSDDDLELSDELLLLGEDDEDEDDTLILAIEDEDEDDTLMLAIEDEDEKAEALPDISVQFNDILSIKEQSVYTSLKNSHWKILIVDDDPQVHDVTILALQGFDFEQKPIKFISAFDDPQTRELLGTNPDIAVILMDVVMENQDTGLKLIRHIRNELRNTMVRIILRTGQPGEAPEHSVIIDYDINDYKLKTEMTHRRLFTTIISALRSYRDLLTIEQYRLQQIRMANIQHELELARQIQSNILPSPTPEWEELDIVCFSVPAREIGGDFYTYYNFNLIQPKHRKHHKSRVKTQRYAVTIGDVSGKGMPAALLMAVSLVSFNFALKRIYSHNNQMIDIFSQPYSIHSLMQDLDEAISYYISSSRQNCAIAYVEIIISQADNTEEILMRTVNAGCIPPYIKWADGSVEMLDTYGFPLGQGLSKMIEYKETSLKLSKGDFIIVTTDGIIEANNEDNELFGFDRFQRTLQSAPMTSATALLEHVKQTVSDYIGTAEQHDDMTMAVIRI